MPRVTPKRGRATIALLAVPLACLGLGACGSSSGGSASSPSTPASTHTTAEAPATTATTAPPASTTPTSTTPSTTSTSREPTIRTAKQFSEVYECLRHNGIALPPLKSVKSVGEVKVNTNTPQYQSTLNTCRHKVLG